jgi:hypothetical protein
MVSDCINVQPNADNPDNAAAIYSIYSLYRNYYKMGTVLEYVPNRSEG